MSDSIPTEEALRISEARYREITELLSDSFYSVLVQPDGSFTREWGFETFEHLTGVPVEAVLQDDWQRILHPDDVQRFLQRHERLQRGEDVITDYRIVTNSGAVRWLRDHARPVWDEHQGRVVRIYGAVQDITAYKQAEEHMKQHAARAEALVRVAARLNAQLDLDTLLLTVCEEATRALHVSGACIGLYHDDEDAIHYVSSTGIAPALTRQLSPLPRAVITSLIEQHGDIITLISSQMAPEMLDCALLDAAGFPALVLHVLMREGTLVGVLVLLLTDATRYLTDDEATLLRGIAYQAAQAITNARLFTTVQEEQLLLSRRVDESTASLRVANAELARATRLKDEFLANMSHELRTPLNAILGLSEVLQEQIYGPLNERQSGALATIEESGRHLLALINDILDIARIEAGKFELEMTRVHVAMLCDTTLRLITPMAQEKHLSLTTHIESSVVDVYADARYLKQVLMNLLSNAVKFTPAGGSIGLEVSGDAAQGVVRFTVWDSGIGIAETDMQYLFQRFVQLDGSLKRQYAGTGLGLVLVARIVELHGGSVSVESEVGHGSRFTVALPWHEQVPPGTLSGQHLASERSQHAVRQALIIEDSPLVVERLTRYLGELGIYVVVQSTTEEVNIATEAATLLPDVIILDPHLRDQSGWDILTCLKSHAPTRAIPVIVLSSIAQSACGVVQGADAYLIKPVTRSRLQHVLHSIVRANEAGSGSNPQRGAAEHPPAATAPLVLLAEDNEDSVIMVQDYLIASGYRIAIAWNGAEAVEQARTAQPDIIIMDIQMPGMDGLEAIRRIRAGHDAATVPIVALTALAMPGDRQRCLEAGANEYLSKPVPFKLLKRVIQEQLHAAGTRKGHANEQE